MDDLHALDRLVKVLRADTTLSLVCAQIDQALDDLKRALPQGHHALKSVEDLKVRAIAAKTKVNVTANSIKKPYEST